MVSKSIVGALAQKAGGLFEQRMLESWYRVPGTWRLKIGDGVGSERPADEIILLNKVRLLAENKRTDKLVFAIGNNLKPHQWRAGVEFSCLNPNNISAVFLNFYNDKVDRTFAIEMISLMQYMVKYKTKSIGINDMNLVKSIEIFILNGVYCLLNFEEDALRWK